MSHLHLQEAIRKLCTDEKYREQVKTEPGKLAQEYELEAAQIEVFFLEDLKPGGVIKAQDRTCCCC